MLIRMDISVKSNLYGPFDILEKAYEAGCLTAEGLLAYCKKEIGKNKYDSVTQDLFNDLVMNLTQDTDPEAYISMQDRLFAIFRIKVL